MSESGDVEATYDFSEEEEELYVAANPSDDEAEAAEGTSGLQLSNVTVFRSQQAGQNAPAEGRDVSTMDITTCPRYPFNLKNREDGSKGSSGAVPHPFLTHRPACPTLPFRLSEPRLPPGQGSASLRTVAFSFSST